MRRRREYLVSALFLVISLLLTSSSPLEASEEARGSSVILMIGDGMGTGQLTAAKISLGLDNRLNIEGMIYGGTMTTHSDSDWGTDSAASGTAMATGYKTTSGRIGVAPNGTTLPTVLEFAESLGMSTGLVTTTRVTYATPAAFASHVTSRAMEDEIAVQIIHSGVDVVLGGGTNFFPAELIEEAVSLGFTYVASRADLLELAPDSDKLLGLFTPSHMNYEEQRNPEVEPSLAEMTDIAMELLSRNPKGFFLMVEGGRIDHAGHENNLEDAIGDTLAFDEAVGVALDFVRLQGNTTLIVTADHETGGLSILEGPVDGAPGVGWTWTRHTGNLVPVYSEGPFASLFSGLIDNTDVGKGIFTILVSAPDGVDVGAQEQIRRLLLQIDDLKSQLSSASSELAEREADLESAISDLTSAEEALMTAVAELASLEEQFQTVEMLAYVAAAVAIALALILLVTSLRRRAST